ncbi:hypothetical protein MHEL_42400 [Mycolicibacterium helvum]|uniref:Uncharacterized protein n=1 Tax=Mycolicibacterium helvum TaxID=1534349 RepID=A0A7I7T9Q6_9MYCO|nr:hypothetical protein MHEL_42400 [Mycolicibacterium helvum]
MVIITNRHRARNPEAKCAIGDMRITTGLAVDASGVRREDMAESFHHQRGGPGFDA